MSEVAVAGSGAGSGNKGNSQRSMWSPPYNLKEISHLDVNVEMCHSLDDYTIMRIN